MNKTPFNNRVVQKVTTPKPAPNPIPHHSGKGTKARLNTAAEKHFFGSKISK